MSVDQRVAAHYGHGHLIKAIEAGLAKLRLSPDAATIHDLARVDEFHIGGRAPLGLPTQFSTVTRRFSRSALPFW